MRFSPWPVWEREGKTGKVEYHTGMNKVSFVMNRDMFARLFSLSLTDSLFLCLSGGLQPILQPLWHKGAPLHCPGAAQVGSLSTIYFTVWHTCQECAEWHYNVLFLITKYLSRIYSGGWTLHLQCNHNGHSTHKTKLISGLTLAGKLTGKYIELE